MKHLNTDFRRLNIQVNDALETPDDYEASFHRYSELPSKLGPDHCLDCKRRMSNLKKLDRGSKSSDSFEDLGSDCLINQIRFIAIDCRVNQLREEGTLPHSLPFDLSGSTKIDSIRK
jgi:hypothetical protein